MKHKKKLMKTIHLKQAKKPKIKTIKHTQTIKLKYKNKRMVMDETRDALRHMVDEILKMHFNTAQQCQQQCDVTR